MARHSDGRTRQSSWCPQFGLNSFLVQQCWLRRGLLLGITVLADTYEYPQGRQLVEETSTQIPFSCLLTGNPSLQSFCRFLLPMAEAQQLTTEQNPSEEQTDRYPCNLPWFLALRQCCFNLGVFAQQLNPGARGCIPPDNRYLDKFDFL